MPKFSSRQIPLGMCFGLGNEDYADVRMMMERLPPTGAPLPEHPDPQIKLSADEWEHLLHKVRYDLKQPYTLAETLDIADMLRAWRHFSEELLSVVESAHSNVQKVLGTVSTQRVQTFAVSGRMLWGTVTLLVPPPVGVLLGAFIYAACEDNLRASLQKFIEWGLQTPESYRQGTGLTPRTGPNAFPRNPLPGGQEKVKDLKDLNQMFKSLEKVFAGRHGRVVKEWNAHSLRNLVVVPGLDAGHGRRLRQTIERSIEASQSLLRGYVIDQLEALVQDDRKLLSLARVCQHLQADAISTAQIKPKAIIREGVQLFVNRMVYELIESLKGYRGVEQLALPAASQSEVRRKLECYLVANHFNQTRQMSKGRVANMAAQTKSFFGRPADPLDRYGVMYGYVPEDLFSSSWGGTMANWALGSPLEEKLQQLGIVHKTADEAAILAWTPTRLEERAAPAGQVANRIPYKSIDPGFRGRLSAWATHYAGDDRREDHANEMLSTILPSGVAPRPLI